jgi:hypothetical protein
MKNTENNETSMETGDLPGKIPDRLTRDDVLRLSSHLIRALHKRVSSARFKEQSSDGAKLSHIRALITILQVYGALLRDVELTQLDQRIGELEKIKEMRLRE